MMNNCLPALLIVSATLTAQVQPRVLHTPSVVLPVDSAPFQRLLDLDGDGDMDAVGAREWAAGGRYELSVWENVKGDLVQRQKRAIGTNLNRYHSRGIHIATGDWDADGKDDFVVTEGSRVDLWLARGVAKLQLKTFPILNKGYLVDAKMADVDGDGKLDMVCLERAPASYGPTQLSVHYAKGGTATFPRLPVQDIAKPYLLTFDANGDKAMEIGVCNTHSCHVYRVANSNLSLDRTFVARAFASKFLWAAGDIDGDKDTDAVVFLVPYTGQPIYQVFRRTAAKTFVAESFAIGGPAEYLADIDGDGDLDGVCCGGGGGPNNNYYYRLGFASTFELAQNDGKGRFALSWAFPGSGSRSMAGVADLDGDGDVELVAGRVIYHGEGPWRSHPMPPTGAVAGSVRRRHIGDADRDGDVDVQHNPKGGSRGRGDGSFVRPSLAGVTPPAGFKLGDGFDVDFDGDGATDQIVPMFTATWLPMFDSMVWLRNNGGGTYHYAGRVAPKGLRIGFGVTVDHFAHGDLDGDGDMDLVANSDPTVDGYKCQIYWNDNLKLVAGPQFGKHRFEGVADFDGDNRPDLLMTEAARIHIARGTGNRVSPFVVAPTLAVTPPFRPNGLSIDDVNEDGRPDFVAMSSQKPTLYLNLTTGWKSCVLDVTLEKKGEFVTVADFNGDDRVDVLAGPMKGEPNIAMLFLAKSTAGPVRTSADYTTSRTVVPDGFAADVDEDGDVDLVGMRTVFGLRFHGDDAGHKQQFGNGAPGEGGSIPILGRTGPVRPGADSTLCLRGVPGPTGAFLGIALGEKTIADFPVPGLTLRLDPASLIVVPLAISGQGAGRGAASLVIPTRVPKALGGARLYLQAVVLDAKALRGVTITNLLRERIGR